MVLIPNTLTSVSLAAPAAPTCIMTTEAGPAGQARTTMAGITGTGTMTAAGWDHLDGAHRRPPQS